MEETKKILVQKKSSDQLLKEIDRNHSELQNELDGITKKILDSWESKKANYSNDKYVFKVRDKEIRIKTTTESLSHTKIKKVALPRYKDFGEVVRWSLQENVPGEFPFTAGVYPFKRKEEDPTRMFAGEGGPERTNKRFHYVSIDMPANRLSTAFDSVTLLWS